MAVHEAGRGEAAAAVDAGGARGRLGRGRPGQVEGDVLDQDRPLQLLQLAAGLQAEFVRERVAGAAVRRERVHLPAVAVQREHELGDRSFPVGLLLDDAFEIADDIDEEFEMELDDPVLRRKLIHSYRIVSLPDEG